MTVIMDFKGYELFKADDLAGCIPFLYTQNVKMVKMVYTWNRYHVIDAPDRWPFLHEGTVIRANFVSSEIDNEYSYIGDFNELFWDFAEEYSCWDDADLKIIDGVLCGDMDGYDPDAKNFPDTDEDQKVRIMDYESIGLSYLEYYDEESHSWIMMP